MPPRPQPTIGYPQPLAPKRPQTTSSSHPNAQVAPSAKPALPEKPPTPPPKENVPPPVPSTKPSATTDHRRRPSVPHIPSTLSSQKSMLSLRGEARAPANDRHPSRKMSISSTREKIQRRNETANTATLHAANLYAIEGPKGFDLDEALGALLFQAHMIHMARKAKNSRGMADFAAAFNRALAAVVDSMEQHIPASVIGLRSYRVSANRAFIMSDAFQDWSTYVSKAKTEIDIKMGLKRCTQMLDLILEDVKAFLVGIDDQVKQRGGLPCITEDLEDREDIENTSKVPFPQADAPAQNNGQTQTESPIDNRTTFLDMSDIDSMDSGDKDLVEITIRRRSALPPASQRVTGVDIRASLAAAYAASDPLPKDELRDVPLPDVHVTLDIVKNPKNKSEVWGASVEALIQAISDPYSASDSELVDTFFLCYRDFTTAENVIKLFDARYIAPPPAGLSKTQSDAWRQRGRAMELRIISLVRMWLDQYWVEEMDGAAGFAIQTFVQKSVNRDWPSAGRPVLAALARARNGHRTEARFERRQQEISMTVADEARGAAYETEYAAPLLKDLCAMNSVHIGTFRMAANLEELGRQMTLLAAALYCAVVPEELLRHVAKCKGNCNCATQTSLRKIAEFHDATAIWATKQVLSKPDPKARAKVMSIMLCLAIVLYNLRNYESLAAIVQGLVHGSVARLSQTHDLMSKASKKLLGRLDNFVNPSGNHRALRADLDMSCEPTVPLMPVYLQNLARFYHGPRGRMVKSPATGKEIPNIYLYRGVTQCLRTMEQWYLPYSFPAAHEVQVWITEQFRIAATDNINAERDRLYDLSKTLETPDAKKSKLMRMPSLRSLKSVLPHNSCKISDAASLRSFHPK